ncbi:chaperonin 10-like protein [Phyllosticta citribraziliensis]|uniref:Chaperonin 10-like protein n=1 Tax=Phyllosticta citribraziliensis TaxID=989973 RepID=A0ABR1M141_9PEZI
MAAPSQTMRAIALSRHGDATVFHSTTLPKPTASGHDLLVRVHATSVNPVDTKVRAGTYDDYQTTAYTPGPDDKTPQKNALAYFDRAPKPPNHVLGFDGAGVVDEVGDEAAKKGWRVGDDVFYSSSPVRQGANAQWQLVDARSVARKPRSLSWAQAAALPLTWITAWEALVERMGIAEGEEAGVLIVNGAGGVGSVATQIARRILRLPVVVTTASRPETTEFSRSMGASHVINHREPLPPQVEALALPMPIKYVFITYRTEQYMDAAAAICAPFGKVCSIVQTKELNMYGAQWMAKCLTFVWELLGTKPWYGVDVESHGEILRRLASWVDEGRIVSHLRETMPLTVDGIVRAHQAVEASRVVGKVGLEVQEDGGVFM